MNDRLKVLCLYACILLVLSGTASGVYAKQLSVRKIIQNTDIKTGDSVTIALEFDNPFNKSIPITIQDNNVLGSNGLEIQCYEYTLSEIPSATVSYDFPIQAFSAGDFILNSATITYTNPETGDQDSIKTDPLDIHVTQGKDVGLQQGITKIYDCGGVNMRSTSFSSSSTSGSTSISINNGNINQQTDRQTQQSSPSPDNIMQQNQNMQNIKQEMERQQQNYKNMQDELGSRVENNSDFLKMKQELQKQGYTQQDKNIQPESNDTGSFDYSFTKNGDNASISGKMNASRMETINKQSTEDIKKIQQSIERNETFQQMQRGLLNNGYNLSNKKVDLNPNTNSNTSSFEYKYGDQNGRGASISGNITDAGEIKDISLNETSLNEKQGSLPYWMLLILIVPLLGIYLYKRYWNNAKSPLIRSVPQTVFMSPKSRALERLDRAVEMFNSGMQKEAYVEASNAVRIYFKAILGISELTSEEILKITKGSKDEKYVEDIRQCFLLCDLVKFAKYEPNPDDFNRVIEHAKRIIL